MKFRVKMTLCMLGLLSLLFGLGGSLLISVSFQNSLAREKDVAFSAYQMVLSTLQIVNSLEEQGDYQDLAYTLKQLDEQDASAWAALRLASGQETICAFGPAAAYLGGAEELPEPGTCAFRYASGNRDRRYLILSGAVAAGGGPLYLDTAHDITFLYEARRVQQQTYQRVFVGMALLCAGLAYTVSRLLTAPLEGLSRASRAIASGQYASRVRIRSGDEIGAVSADFNAMAARMEETVSALQSAVERQERFMGSFAHELKTPMTSIIGYADLLRGGTLDREEQSVAADYIVSEGKRLERLSRKLLDLLVLKKGELALAPVAPAGLVGALAERLEPAYRAQGIHLSCRCEAGTCLLEADLVRSLVLNLLDNARKALDKGGHITVRTEMLADGCRIQVRDDGRGIPPEALDRLTEAFYRVDRSRSREQGGVGLGLTLCQEIAALHRGTIRFESPAGGGTCVTVELKGGRP